MEVSCHCGNVKLAVQTKPSQLGECNCSICRRYAALWAYYSPSEVDIICVENPTAFYIWGDKCVEFHRCEHCGCLTHYVTTPKCDEQITAINMRMAEGVILTDIPIKKIDGASY
ncbi:aldehyde-activating protein [Vibrio neptunius]|uniref:GFA family protein n=1 Tax=Vibrio neptunius TaxID=170651 RepID=UPI0005FA0C03|nr:aldehyde-activating protein [Vibrio neptunius]KJY91443.1 aldehyde-activating protein [Vibrio neptunius]